VEEIRHFYRTCGRLSIDIKPKLLAYHQHRREYGRLRHQMWTWGLDDGLRQQILAVMRRIARSSLVWWWLCYQFSKAGSELRRNRVRWPWDLVAAEGWSDRRSLRRIDRSIARIERVRRNSYEVEGRFD
jgi:hypothetical protein